MPRYLSAEWVRAFNDALSGVDLTAAVDAAGTGSLTASEGTFSVSQVVTGAPDGIGSAAGEVHTVLTVDQGQVSLALEPTARPANVTMVLGYDDALAIARGELDPADALATGRVRVRGELAVLVAAQSVLSVAAAQIGPALAALTDRREPE